MDKLTKRSWIIGTLFLLVVAFLFGIPNEPLQQSHAGEVQVNQKTADVVASAVIPNSEPPTAEIQNQQPPQPEPPKQPQQQPAAPAPAAPVTPMTVAVINGLSLRIDTIGINIPLLKTGLDSEGHLMVPGNPNTAAWYKAGPVPGNSGTALVTGHYDANGGVPGIFYNLKKLAAGQVIRVGREDGKVAVFEIDKLASYKQDSTFPWNLVYSTSGPAGLRIITCDGTYNPQTGRYSHNLVVYASLTSIE